ncbi:MAG: NADH-quinone oxidoreductase subunit M [Verrucomicrobiia bacterium]
MLDWTIYLSFLGAGLILCLPREQKALIRWIALASGLLGLGLALGAWWSYNAAVPELTKQVALASDPIRAAFRVVCDVPWIPSLKVSYFLAYDGINLPLVVLNGFICVTGILFSWNIEHRTKEFFAFFLALIGGVYGVFLAMDLFLLFVFYELAIIPKYFIIAIWGSTRKEYGAMKLVLYSFVGSAAALLGILALYVKSGGAAGPGFDLLALKDFKFTPEFQFWCFPLVFVGFAVLAGMWPFHSWAPTGHVAAPTAASMLLAGVVMKLGAYGCLRVGMMLMPIGAKEWAFPLGVIAVINIIYGAAVAWVQRDFKFVIGYSSVSHMGFVLLGLMTLTTIGLDGAVLQMFSHGIIAGLLFAVVGRMVYDRTHTRVLAELQAMRLCDIMPFAAVTFVLAGAASMGVPGFSGFVAELQVLIGVWRAFPWLAIACGFGIVLTFAYTLQTILRAFYGERRVADEAGLRDMPPISPPEKIAATILIALTIIVGIYPNCLLNMIHLSIQPLVTLLAK